MERRGRVDGPDSPTGGADDGPVWPAGWHVEIVDETGSTNDDLLARAETAPDRTVLATRHQTAGRGRLDRRWVAPPGTNLLVSILFRPVDDPADRVRRVALALAAAANEVAGAQVGLKWPNDLLVDGRKLSGILAQQASTSEGRALVVGAGCNVGWAPDGAARLTDIAPDARSEPLLAALLRQYDALPSDVTDMYRRALVTLGQRVRVQTPGGDIVGRALDVEPDGRLRVVDDCAVTHRLQVGDVIHLRPD